MLYVVGVGGLWGISKVNIMNASLVMCPFLLTWVIIICCSTHQGWGGGGGICGALPHFSSKYDALLASYWCPLELPV